MIRGLVRAMQARVSVAFRFADGHDTSVEFVVDTGFSGALSLPPATVATLGLPFLQEITIVLADATTRGVAVHTAAIEWQGRQQPVTVLALGARPLLGTALLADLNLHVQFAEGGEVVIR